VVRNLQVEAVREEFLKDFTSEEVKEDAKHLKHLGWQWQGSSRCCVGFGRCQGFNSRFGWWNMVELDRTELHGGRHLNETSESWRSEAKQCALAMGRSRDQDGSGARQIPWMEGLQALGGVFLFEYVYDIL
jgi:hypothetical protein